MRPIGVLVVEDAPAPTGMKRSGEVGAFEHVANRPIVHHVLDALEAVGARDVVVASSDQLAGEVHRCLETRESASAVTLTYVSTARAPLDLASALSLAAPIVRRAPCVVHLAGGLLSGPLTPFWDHVRSGSPDALVLKHQGHATGLEARTSRGEDRIGRLDSAGRLSVPAGVWMFGPGVLPHAALASRADGELDSGRLEERIADAGGSFREMSVDGWRRYAGNQLDLLELNRIALDRLSPAPHLLNDGNQIEGRVQIHARASIRASVIVGPAVIGSGARIADAYIGPYTSIGPGARVEGTEIERSIIGEGASVMHVGGRLMASVIGREARIFRDFSLPRALRLRVGDGTEVAFF